jgi:hypothetical protein
MAVIYAFLSLKIDEPFHAFKNCNQMKELAQPYDKLVNQHYRRRLPQGALSRS